MLLIVSPLLCFDWQVPIVALTGHGEDSKRQKCLDAGIQEVLIKPAEPAAMQNILERFVRKMQTEEKATASVPSEQNEKE